jgi:MFS family permease
MEQIARPLLILHLTDSALMVGLIAATRMVPMLLIGIWAGVLADRMDKRRLLLTSQFVTFGTHVVTAALLLAGVIAPWMVFLTTFIAGTAMAMNQPARQSLIPRLVPEESLANAIALNSAGVNIMRVGGPSLGGLVLALTDFAGLYVCQSLVYVWVLYSTWQITVRTEETRRRQGSMLSELKEGFRSVKHDTTIFYILVLSLVMFVWGMPFQGVFIALIAVDELGLGRSSVGLLLSSVGVGALLGSLAIATFGDGVKRRGWAMIGMMTCFSIALLVFAFAPGLLLIVPALVVAGAMQTSFMSLNNAYVLGRTPREMHGRVMSLFSLDRGLVPLGATIAGVLAESLGPREGLVVMAAICLVCTLLLALMSPALRRIS